MNKLFKNVCGFLCATSIVAGISGVSAATVGEVEIPSISFDENGNANINIKYNKVDEYYYGDVDGDGDIDLTDAQTTLKVAVGIQVADQVGGTTLKASDFDKRADVDGDGEITRADAELILKRALRIPVYFAAKASTDSSSDIAKIGYVWMDEIDNAEFTELYTEYMNLYSQYYVKFTQYAEKYKEYQTTSDEATDREATTLYGEAEQIMTKMNNVKSKIDVYIRTKVNLNYTSNPVELNIGKNETDTKYLYVEVIDNAGNSYTALTSVDTSNFDWDALKNSQTEDTTKEETVENPKTAIILSISGLVSALLIGGIVAKKKNVFNRI